MRAAVFKGAGRPLALETLPDPKPGPSDVIIRVHRCGICGTDLHMTSGHGWDFPLDCVPGHEYAGEVVEVGSAVERLKKGDIITALPTEGCGHCEACFRGAVTLCRAVKGVMGGFGEYLRVPEKVAIRLPSTYSLADGALVEPFTVGLNGVRMAALAPGDRVLVLGGGSVALTTLFWAKRLGASRLVAISRSQRRAALALAMGADAFVQSGPDDGPKVVEALGGTPDIVFECVGTPGLLQEAIRHVGLFGKIVSQGFCTSPDPMIPALAALKAATLSFPVGYSLRDFEFVADTLLRGDLDPKTLITAVVPLGDLPATFERLRNPNNETKVQVSLASG